MCEQFCASGARIPRLQFLRQRIHLRGLMGCSSPARVAAPPKKVDDKFADQYVLGQLLGKGSFGHVFAAEPLRPSASSVNELYAVKVVSFDPPGGKHRESIDDRQPTPSAEQVSPWSMVSRELAMWRCVGKKNKHCVRLLENFEEDGRAYFVMERCHCPVSHLLIAKPLDKVGRSREFFTQMLKGIAHVHSVGIVHRDVKPDNFLADGCEGDVIKLSDFGLAKYIPIAPKKLIGTHGTPAFMSPEMLLRQGYGAKTDVWSVGSMFYFLLFGFMTYAPRAQCVDEVKNAIRMGAPAPKYQWQGECQTCVMKPYDIYLFEPILRRTLQRDPAERPSSDALLTEFLDDQGDASEILSLASDSCSSFDDIPYDSCSLATTASTPSPRPSHINSSKPLTFDTYAK